MACGRDREAQLPNDHRAYLQISFMCAGKKKKSLGVKHIAILNILLYLTESNADIVSDHYQIKTSTKMTFLWKTSF